MLLSGVVGCADQSQSSRRLDAAEPAGVPAIGASAPGTLAGTPPSLESNSRHPESFPSGVLASPLPATPSYPQFARGSSPASVTASLSAACIQPGQPESLALHGPAGMYVAFDTQYADQKDGKAYGGVGTGRIAAAGSYSSTWTVAAGTPPGQATVFISAVDSRNNSTAFRQPTFIVAIHC